VSRKVHKTIIVTPDLADRLEAEDNMSETVRDVLREHYNIDE